MFSRLFWSLAPSVRLNFGGAICSIAVITSFISPAAAAGQTTDPFRNNNNNLPSGSPLNGAVDPQSGSSAESRTVRPSPQSDQYEAVNINGRNRNADNQRGDQADFDRDENDQYFSRPIVNPRLKPITQSEFERYVQSRTGIRLPRFGADLLLPENRDYAVPATATVPASYVLNVGDVVKISLTGSIDGSFDATVNTDGKIFLPKVGSIALAGVRYGDLKDVVSRAIGTQYRGYDVTVAINRLRGLRVYVTGFANNPGAYSVNSLSTLVNAVLAAGGPSSGGSLRSVKLFRNGRLVTDFDLYDLLLNGNRSKDATLQNEDVLFIPPLGNQVAVTGSVNNEAIYEMKPGETLDRLLAYAGGVSVLADPTRLMLYRADHPENESGQEISRATEATIAVMGGDIVQVLTTGSLQRPIDRQTVVVRIEGEVRNPGNYIVPPNTPLGRVVELAGGFTPQAYLYGTKLERVSVKSQQRESYQEAIKQLEISLSSTALTSTRLDTANREAELASARAVLDRLRGAEPDGRLVLDVNPAATELPADLIMETNDRITIPPRPVTVGVFGAVYRPASFILNSAKNLRVRDYVERAGGALRSADRGGIFLVRVSGDVISSRRGAMRTAVLPGDVVFVPVKTESNSLLAKLRDITQIIFQLGIGAATFVAVTR